MIDRSNRNRYRLVVLEKGGFKTAYYFSVPIYNTTSRRLLDLKFQSDQNSSHLLGSCSDILICDSIHMKDRHDICRIAFPGALMYRSEHCIRYFGAEVYPTTNGVALRVELDQERKYRFRLHTGRAFYQIRHNGKCLALMAEKFKPFVTVSCIGSLYHSGELCAPAEIQYKKYRDTEFELTVSSRSPYARYALLEINLQEEKLIQDTTVESRHPDQNNAFGGTAWLGKTDAYGEQWLYSRLVMSKLNDLFERKLLKLVLHIPMWNRNHAKLSAFGLSTRFCSFGSKWSNKKSGTTQHSTSEVHAGYQNIDLTHLLTRNQRLLTTNEGWILRSAESSNGASTVSTGDSFYAPQILEVVYQI